MIMLMIVQGMTWCYAIDATKLRGRAWSETKVQDLRVVGWLDTIRVVRKKMSSGGSPQSKLTQPTPH